MNRESHILVYNPRIGKADPPTPSHTFPFSFHTGSPGHHTGSSLQYSEKGSASSEGSLQVLPLQAYVCPHALWRQIRSESLRRGQQSLRWRTHKTLSRHFDYAETPEIIPGLCRISGQNSSRSHPAYSAGILSGQASGRLAGFIPVDDSAAPDAGRRCRVWMAIQNLN